MDATFRTDWLGSRPVFYNTRTRRVSENVNDVIDPGHLEFHPEGLNNFLDFGFAVFEQTPLAEVKFLPPCASLTLDPSGELRLGKERDPLEEWDGRETDERQVLERLEAAVSDWEAGTTGEIVLPLSGGFDSRLLALMLRNPARARAFSYGISEDQEQSSEVVLASALAERLKIRWERIPLGDYHRHLDEWDALYGVSTHAHGMYHLEFFGEIARRVGEGRPLLSGMVGDAWAGSIAEMPVRGPEDLGKLGYSHGLHASSRYSRLRDRGELRQRFWDEHRARFEGGSGQAVWVIRIKMMLLSYLLRVPEHLGFRPWTPFLDPGLVLAMIGLPAERRKGRRWQRDYFRRRGADLEALNLTADPRNTLDLQGLRRIPPAPLDAALLAELIEPEYVARVNQTMLGSPTLRQRIGRAGRATIAAAAKVAPPLRRRLSNAGKERLAAYNAYMTLRPIETLLRRRNAA